MEAMAFDLWVPRFLHADAVQSNSKCTSYVRKTVDYTNESDGDVKAAVSLEDAIVEKKQAESTRSSR